MNDHLSMMEMETAVMDNPTAAIATMEPEAAWQATLGELKLQMTRATFNTWVKDTAVRQVRDDGTFVVQVKNEYAQEWLDKKLRVTIERTLADITGQPTAVEFVLSACDEQPKVYDNQTVPDSLPSGPPPPPETPTDGRTVIQKHPDGYNGNMTPDERAELLERIESRELLAKASAPAVLKRDQAFIDLVEMPTEAFLATPHYAHKFWRPYLGLVPFSLWEILRSYAFFVRYHNSDWPTISVLVDTLGYGDRYTILGRAERVVNAGTPKEKVKPAVQGALDILAANHICDYSIDDSQGHRHRAYRFRVANRLRMLTPSQVDTLSKRKQKEHRLLLQRFPDFDYAAWEKSTEVTFMAGL